MIDPDLLDNAEEEHSVDAAADLLIQVTQPGQGGGTLLIAVADPENPNVKVQTPETEAFFTEQAKEPAQTPSELAALSLDGERDMPRTAPETIPVYSKLADVVGVRLRPMGPVTFFLTKGQAYSKGDKVMIDMEGSPALAEVVNSARVDPARLMTEESGKLRPVIRKAGEQEIATAAGNSILADEAVRFCKDCIRERDLEMKLVDVLVMQDRGKMIFYFTAPARIDFRELVKDLVRKYRTRIELRQIGVRHETQMAGAVGNCGMVCCCRRYLRKFAPVAIKMAKEQNVFLNPVKISGICGRLLCCLAYEQDHYDEFYRRCPKLGKKYQTDKGVVRVLRASLFRESISVLTETNEEAEYTLTEWKTLNPHRPDASQPQPQPQAQNTQPDSPRREENTRSRGQDRHRNTPGAANTAHSAGAASAAGAAGAASAAPAGGSQGAPSRSVEARGSTNTANVTPVGAATPRPVPAEAEPDDEILEDISPNLTDLVDGADDADDADDSGSIFGLAPRKPAASPERQPSDSRPRSSTPGGNRHHNRRN